MFTYSTSSQLLGVSTLQRQNTEISKQIIPEKEYRSLSPNFHIHAPVSDLYIPTIGLPILLEEIWRPLGLRPRYSQKTNTQVGSSLQCIVGMCGVDSVVLKCGGNRFGGLDCPTSARYTHSRKWESSGPRAKKVLFTKISLTVFLLLPSRGYKKRCGT